MERRSSGLGWVLAVLAFGSFFALAWSMVRRHRARVAAEALVSVSAAAESRDAPSAVQRPVSDATSQAFRATLPLKAALANRPPKVRNLLMRLDEAERRKDVAMAVTTIEEIRKVPGSPAADLDDELARKLGALNLCWLFDLRNAQWVRQVTVGRGDSASRIASENGSTLSSLRRLNDGDIDRIVVGQKLYVMNHPRFNLVLHRRTRTADLLLNGKFFRRYDLARDVTANAGAYEMPDRRASFWNGIGASFRKEDRTELDMFLPRGTAILVSEM